MHPILQWQSNTYSKCVYVALGIQHAMRTRRVMLSTVACPALQYFSTLAHKKARFSKNKSY